MLDDKGLLPNIPKDLKVDVMTSTENKISEDREQPTILRAQELELKKTQDKKLDKEPSPSKPSSPKFNQ